MGTISSCRCLDLALELRVGARPPDELEVDAEPGRIELEHLAHDGLQAFVDPDVGHPRAVPHRQLGEEILLGGEVVEDRAAREADRLLQPRDRRALVAVLRERTAGAGEDLLAAFSPALVGDLRHRVA